MNDTKQALEAAAALVAKATPGEWTFCEADDGDGAAIQVAPSVNPWPETICDEYYPHVVSVENMRAIAAAVNLIRTHGPALIAALEDRRPPMDSKWMWVPRDLLADLADDLAAELSAHQMVPRRLENDLEPVRRARALLEATPSPEQEAKK